MNYRSPAARDQGLDEAAIADLRRHFDERQIVELGWAAGAFIAFGRLIHVFGAKWEADAVPGRR